MLLSTVSVLVVVQLSSEVPEGLMNYPVFVYTEIPNSSFSYLYYMVVIILNVSFAVPYSCLLFSICVAYAEAGLLVLMQCAHSFCLTVIDLPDYPI